MRHRKHNHQLGVKSAHRVSLVANLSCSLIEHGRIKTTLAKARALRPAVEKIITLAKKAHSSDDAARKIHYRRLAIARLRNKKAVSKLFDDLVDQFMERNGGYTRIYKLALPRLGDAADMALIEFVEEATKQKAKKKKTAAKKHSGKPSAAKDDSPDKKTLKSDESKEVASEKEKSDQVEAAENSSDKPAASSKSDSSSAKKAETSKDTKDDSSSSEITAGDDESAVEDPEEK